MNFATARASLTRFELKEAQLLGERRRLGNTSRNLRLAKEKVEDSFKEHLRKVATDKLKILESGEASSQQIKFENLQARAVKLKELKVRGVLIQKNLGALTTKLAAADKELKDQERKLQLLVEKKLPIIRRISKQIEETANELAIEGKLLSRRSAGCGGESIGASILQELPIQNIKLEGAPIKTEPPAQTRSQFAQTEQAKSEVSTWRNLNGSGIELNHTLRNGKEIQLTVSSNLVRTLNVSLMALGRERYLDQERFAVVRALKTAGVQNFRITNLQPRGDRR